MFYYKFTANVGTGVLQSDGLYAGDRGYSAREQKINCLEYIKLLVKPGTHFQHRSCTPQNLPLISISGISGTWGDTINQHGKINELDKKYQKSILKFGKIKREIDAIHIHLTKLASEAESLAPSFDSYKKQCNRTFIIPDEQGGYDDCVIKYNALKNMQSSISSRVHQNKKALLSKMDQINATEEMLKITKWDINRRILFQKSAQNCIKSTKVKTYECVNKLWIKLTRGF